jgi:hypothetical protein
MLQLLKGIYMEYFIWIGLIIAVIIVAKINNYFIDFKKVKDNEEYSVLEKEGVTYLVIKDIPKNEVKRTLWIYNKFIKNKDQE